MTSRRRVAGAAFLVLAAASGAGTQTIQDTARIAHPEGTRFGYAVFSADGRLMAGYSRDRKIRLFALPSGQLVRTVDTGGDRTSAMALSSDGRWLATGSTTGAVTLRDTRTGAATASAGSRPVTILSFSSDGASLAVAVAGTPGELWQVVPFGRRVTLATEFGGTSALEFSPDGRLLASADEDNRLRVYRTDSGALQFAVDLVLAPLAVGFAPDGASLVFGGVDRALTVLDPRRGTFVRRLPAQANVVSGLSVLRGGKVVAAYFDPDDTGKEKPLLVWDAATATFRILSTETGIRGGRTLRDGAAMLAFVSDAGIVVRTIR